MSENVECASFVTFSYCDKNYYKNDTVERALAPPPPPSSLIIRAAGLIDKGQGIWACFKSNGAGS